VKPKGRQGAKKKAPAAAKEVEEDEMLDLAQRLAQYNFGSAPADSSKTAETSKAIAVDDDDDDVVVEVAPVKKGGRKPAATKAAKPPAAPRKRGKQTVASTEVLAIGVSPEKKVRKMRSSPFNKKSSSVMSRLADNKEEESSENVAGNSSSEKSGGDVSAISRPQRANRRKMTYVLSDSESESANDSEFDDIEDDEDDE
jgi:DNA topoisomerase-2